jgi:hypothetical protein
VLRNPDSGHHGGEVLGLSRERAGGIGVPIYSRSVYRALEAAH